MRELFSVTWCSSIPVDANGDSDFDSAVEEIRFFWARDEARAFARTVAQGAVFDCARIQRAVPITRAAALDSDGDVFRVGSQWYEESGHAEEVEA